MEEKKKNIRNVRVLDIRKATEESIASIGSIGNIGMLLYSPETAKFILRLSTGNIGESVVKTIYPSYIKSEHFF